jgi:hypothetical protein
MMSHILTLYLEYDMANTPVWAIANAWREILARIFENIKTDHNVSPEWLLNPATRRRLKLDMLYPNIGVAVRMEGLSGRHGRQRLSLEEEEQEQIRRQARAEICRAHHIELIVVHLGDEPKEVFRAIDLALSRAGQHAKDADASRQISLARATATSLSHRIRSESDLGLYAELWQDRQYQIVEPANTSSILTEIPAYEAGMEVEHTIFGPGMILTVIPSGDDVLLTVDFVTAGQKTLAASLVAGKLTPVT